MHQWNVETGRKRVALQVWDADEREQFEAVAPIHTRGAQMVLYVLDLCDDDGPGACRRKLENCPASAGAACILVGNRPHGGERVVAREEAEALAEEYNMPYLECCVKTGEGIGEIREAVLQRVADIDLLPDPRVEGLEKALFRLREKRARLERKLGVSVQREVRSERYQRLARGSRAYGDLIARVLEEQGRLGFVATDRSAALLGSSFQ